MRAPLDELYFVWLYGQVGKVEIDHPARSYWDLLKILYTKEFVWFVPNDDNRVEDGRDLRLEFAADEGIADVDQSWLQLGCSMLEMLVALSRRLSFLGEGEARTWFWLMLENIKLDGYVDASSLDVKQIDKILDKVIWRTYTARGVGGLFPLKRTTDDQRKVEIWYQLNAYLIENGY